MSNGIIKIVMATINIDQSGANKNIISVYNKHSFFKIEIRQYKYQNNIVEQDPRIIKNRIVDGLGFNEFESISRTIAGVKLVHLIRKEQIISRTKSTFKAYYSLAS